MRKYEEVVGGDVLSGGMVHMMSRRTISRHGCRGCRVGEATPRTQHSWQQLYEVDAAPVAPGVAPSHKQVGGAIPGGRVVEFTS